MCAEGGHHTRFKMAYVCHVCGRLCAKRRNLADHFRRMHAPKLTYFRCGECNQKDFANLRNLKRHVATVHFKVKTAMCPVCGAMFGRDDNMKRHLKLCSIKKGE